MYDIRIRVLLSVVVYALVVLPVLPAEGVGCMSFFFFQAEDGIRDLVRSRGLGDVYKRQRLIAPMAPHLGAELWQQLGNESSLEESGWPAWNLSLIHI